MCLLGSNTQSPTFPQEEENQTLEKEILTNLFSKQTENNGQELNPDIFTSKERTNDKNADRSNTRTEEESELRD
jgi:hypothetical protein